MPKGYRQAKINFPYLIALRFYKKEAAVIRFGRILDEAIRWNA